MKKLKKLTAKDLIKKYGEGIRNFTNVNLRGQNLKEANLQGADFSDSQLQGANFSDSQLQGANFSNTRLHGANFNKAKLADAKFANAITGMSFLSSLISLSITFLVSFLGATAALSISTLFVIPLTIHLEDSQFNTQYMITIAYIATFIVGFLHFWIISLLKNMDEAVWGFLMTTITIFLLVLDQPLTNILSWCIIISGLIQITKLLFARNYFFILVPIAFVIIIIGLILYNYNWMRDSENVIWIPLICGVLIINIVSSFSLAIIFVQIRNVTYQKKTVILSIIFVILPIIFVILVALIYGISSVIISEASAYSINYSFGYILGILILILGVSGILGIPGIFIGWQSLRGNPNYRLIRDCGVWLCHWFGTNFQEADLTNADFSYATLHNANFTKANLKHTQWQGAKRIEYARFGNSYLRYSKIRKLMINSDIWLTLYSKKR